MRQAGLEVTRVLLQRDVVALHPFDEGEGSGSDRLAGGVAAFDSLAVHDLAVGREIGQERAERRLEMEDGYMRIAIVHRRDLRVESGVCARGLRIEDSLERVFDVGRSELLAIMEDGIVDQIELPGRRIDLRP